MRYVMLGVVAAALLVGCAPTAGPIMPHVVGLQLDAAESSIQSAGYPDDLDVVGGGLFGILDKGNWQVCQQNPPADRAITEKPSLTVERSCTKESAAPSSTGGPKPTSSGGAVPSSTAPAPVESRVAAAPSPSATVTFDWSDFEKRLHFDQTARFEVDDVTIEVKIGAPVRFTPGKDAFVREVYSNLLRDGELREHSAFFPVTISNRSSTKPFDTDFVFSTVREDPPVNHNVEGEIIVHDGDVSGLAYLPQEIAPGQSVTLKDGFSLHNLDRVTYIFKASPTTIEFGAVR